MRNKTGVVELFIKKMSKIPRKSTPILQVGKDATLRRHGVEIKKALASKEACRGAVYDSNFRRRLASAGKVGPVEAVQRLVLGVGDRLGEQGSAVAVEARPGVGVAERRRQRLVEDDAAAVAEQPLHHGGDVARVVQAAVRPALELAADDVQHRLQRHARRLVKVGERLAHVDPVRAPGRERHLFNDTLIPSRSAPGFTVFIFSTLHQ